METDDSESKKGFSLTFNTNCKTELTELHGVIESPNYPSQYPESLNCKWKIKAPKGNKIFLEFSHFELESNSYEGEKCSYDYITISDIVNERQLNTKKYCGEDPPKYNSTGNELLVTFISDFSQSASGFRLEYKIEGCIDTFTNAEGQFSSPKYPKLYPNDIECIWKIVTDFGNVIELTILDMDIEHQNNCTNDGLLIADGNNESKLISKLCGQKLRYATQFTSNSNEMFIKFYTNSVKQSKGFNATYKTFKSHCGGKLTGTNGFIYSPNYPRNYDSNSYCTWLIQTGADHTLNLTIEEFDIEESENCTDDYVTIYNGKEPDEEQLLLKTCGQAIPEKNTFTSTGNQMLITFKTDHLFQFKGFKMSYKQNCGQRILANDSGLIALERLNHDSKFCIWTIMAAEYDQHITFTTTLFEEYSSVYLMNDLNGGCLNSGAVIYDGDSTNAPIKRKLCSNHPPTITSFGRALTIKVSLDIVSHFEGYYTILENACGGTLKSIKGQFSTPLYPDSYPINTQCIWIIEATDGNSIELNIESLNIEDSEDCNKDYLEIRENDLNGKILGLHCGDLIPQQIKALKKIWIKFNSDNDKTGKGFYAKYNYGHHTELSAENGIVTSPRYPSNAPMTSPYTWRINVERGNIIQLNLIDFQEDIFHYNKIFDGFDISSNEIFPDAENPTILSTTNILFIYSSKGPFMLQWNSSPRESISTNITDTDSCPQNRTIILKNGISKILNSPGFPFGYEHNLHCSWIIMPKDIGNQIVMELLTVDLESDDKCTADYITISKGNDLINWKQIENKICNMESNAISEYNGTYLKVEFESDISVNKTGFSSILKTKCGGVIHKSSGVLNYSIFDGQYKECVWIIKTRPGSQIKFEFIQKNFNNKCDFILRNGDNEESPLLGDGNYCKQNAENEIPYTSHNAAYIKFMKANLIKVNWVLKFNEVKKECGRKENLDMNNKIAIISTPSFPSSPDPYSECVWIITGPLGSRLRIQFDEKFDLMQSNDCENEYVKIYDGATRFAKLIEKICGTAANTIYTMSNSIRVEYFSDIPVPKAGFKANVSIDVCGGSFYQKTGTIVSPNYPNRNSYPFNQICEYEIKRPLGSQINLTFVNIDLYCNNDDDGISVYSLNEFDDNSSEKLYSDCKNIIVPHYLTTNSNKILIRFKSSNKTNNLSADHSGFKIIYTSSDITCLKDLESETGVIMSPNYPNGIQTNIISCRWNIKVPEGQRIELKIIDFDLHYPSFGKFGGNFVQKIFVYNYDEFSSKLTEITSNTSRSESIFSSGNMMTLFSVMYGNRGKGFKLEYKSSKSIICKDKITQQSGEIQISSITENTYVCEYNAFAKENETMTIKILSLIIQNTTADELSYSCNFQNPLSFSNSQRELLKTFCKNITIPYVLSSPFPDLKIRLIQVETVKIKEFKMTYARSKCGGILKLSNKLNISQLDVGINNSDCAWQILSSNEDASISVVINIDLKADCEAEYLNIYHDINLNSPHLNYSKFCRQMSLNSTVFKGLYIEYHSVGERNINSKFFITMDYSESCGGHLSSPFPDIKLNKIYNNMIECIWYLHAPLGYILELEFFDRFFIQSSKNCSQDYLLIEDVTERYEVIAVNRFCGREKPPNILSKNRNMKIIAHTDDDNIHGDGFSIHIKAKCGGLYLVKKEKSIFSSPNYPKSYYPDIDCNYTFIAPEDEMISIRVLDFQLETSDKCRFDNLTVCVGGNNEYNGNEYDECNIYCEDNSLKEIRHKSRVTIIFKTDSGYEKSGFLLEYSLDDCGGNIHTSGHIIHSPSKIADGTYLNHMNCYWNITAPEGQKIVLKFELFEMEYSLQCLYDYVEIYSGKLPTSDGKLARLCGNLTDELPIMNLKENHAVIHTHTDVSNSYRGFKIIIKFTTKCDEEISIKFDEIYNFDKFSDKYDNNLDCHIIFNTSPGYHIKLSFESFNLKKCLSRNMSNECDCVEIRDGKGPFAELIGSYSGNILPTPSDIISTKSSLYMRFTTDSIGTSSGFVAKISALPTVCGPTQITVNSTKSVYLTSPTSRTNNLYLPNVRCQWEISSLQYNLHFYFEKFDLQDADSNNICSSDYLEIVTLESSDIIHEGLGESLIYTGSKEYSQKIADTIKHVYCGNQIPSDYYVNKNKAYVRFKTNSVIQNKGFKLKILTDSNCIQNYTSTQGRVKFETSTKCKFQINAPSNYSISLYYNTIKFTEANCENEYFKVIDLKTQKELQKLCDTNNIIDYANSLFTNSNQIEIDIKINGYYTSIDLTYLATNLGSGCGGDLYNYEGLFTSPMYPSDIRNNLDCKWNIRVPNNKKILIKFLVFDLGSKTTCSSDYLEIIEKPKSGLDLVTRRFCGEDEPGSYISERDILSVRFRKSMNFDGIGWVIHFSSTAKNGIQLM